MDVRIVPKLAMHNRSKVNMVSECACYYCCKIFLSSEIKEWIDEDDTAVCPYCSIDAVLPIHEENEKDLNFLTKIHNYWF